MLVDERRRPILQVLENKGFVSLTQLGELVGASESTIRRDLEVLDGIGQIRRTRGGAAYVGESLTSFDVRRDAGPGAKGAHRRGGRRSGRAGETVILDGGTTTLEVARELVGRSLQVVTNSIANRQCPGQFTADRTDCDRRIPCIPKRGQPGADCRGST